MGDKDDATLQREDDSDDDMSSDEYINYEDIAKLLDEKYSPKIIFSCLYQMYQLFVLIIKIINI